MTEPDVTEARVVPNGAQTSRLESWLQRHTGPLIAGLGLVLVIAGLGFVDGDATRAASVIGGVALILFGLLLPRLVGRFKLPGMEAELREAREAAVVEAREDAREVVVRTLSEEGAASGIDAERLDLLVAKVDQLLERPQPSPPAAGGRPEVMVCADCGLLAGYERPARPAGGPSNSILTSLLLGPRCRGCGSLRFKLP
jgi:hypothetical protein